MKSVFIVGLGWLGSPLALALKEKGYAVSGSTRSEKKAELLKDQGIEVFPNHELNQSYSCVICTLTPPKTDADWSLHEAILDQANTHGVGQFIYTSSISIYPNKPQLMDESKADYNTSMGELEALYTNRFKGVTIARLGGLYGGDRHPAKYLSGKTQVAQPEAGINLLSQELAVEAICKIVEKGVIDEIFNIVDDEHPSRKEYYTKKCAELGIAPPEFEDSADKGKIIDNSKLKLWFY